MTGCESAILLKSISGTFSTTVGSRAHVHGAGDNEENVGLWGALSDKGLPCPHVEQFPGLCQLGCGRVQAGQQAELSQGGDQSPAIIRREALDDPSPHTAPMKV
ncbi:hypothetical protein G6F31_019181 [Rhizopus arrhizus]|nr:hypothetical protein G6F31_019181 [Rhizopus arrhizus]